MAQKPLFPRFGHRVVPIARSNHALSVAGTPRPVNNISPYQLGRTLGKQEPKEETKEEPVTEKQANPSTNAMIGSAVGGGLGLAATALFSRKKKQRPVNYLLGAAMGATAGGAIGSQIKAPVPGDSSFDRLQQNSKNLKNREIPAVNKALGAYSDTAANVPLKPGLSGTHVPGNPREYSPDPQHGSIWNAEEKGVFLKGLTDVQTNPKNNAYAGLLRLLGMKRQSDFMTSGPGDMESRAQIMFNKPLEQLTPFERGSIRTVGTAVDVTQPFLLGYDDAARAALPVVASRIPAAASIAPALKLKNQFAAAVALESLTEAGDAFRQGGGNPFKGFAKMMHADTKEKDINLRIGALRRPGNYAHFVWDAYKPKGMMSTLSDKTIEANRASREHDIQQSINSGSGNDFVAKQRPDGGNRYIDSVSNYSVKNFGVREVVGKIPEALLPDFLNRLKTQQPKFYQQVVADAIYAETVAPTSREAPYAARLRDLNLLPVPPATIEQIRSLDPVDMTNATNRYVESVMR